MASRRWVAHCVAGVVLMCLAAVGRAQFFGGGASEPEQVAVSAVVDRTAYGAGESGRIAVKLVVPKGLHAQGHRPFDEFLIATEVTVGAAEGLEFGKVKYPVAKEIPTLPGISKAKTMAVYEGTVWVVVPFTVGREANAGARQVKVSVRSQVCDDKSCFAPTVSEAKVSVVVGEGGAAANEGAFAEAMRQKFDESAGGAVATQGSGGVVSTAPVVNADELARLQRLDYAPGNAEEGKLPIWKYLWFAMVGGAILNIMPCVLPVIPLKVMSLVQQAHGDRRVAVQHALVFSAGIVTLFVLLGLVLSGISAASGGAVVYGQQFQSPTFMLVMSGIVLALGLSMLGVWSINPPAAVYGLDQQRGGYVGSFMSGLLATLLATPCSAPFLGPVLAWAFTQPMWASTSVLALVGVGMAVPYVVLAAFPAGIDKLPRTGRWTELLKQFFGMVMIGVAVYLLTTVPDPGLWPFALGAMMVVALACWAWGQIPTYDMTRARVWTIRVVSLLVAAGLLFGVYRFLHPANAAKVAESASAGKVGEQLRWEPFSLAALEKGLAEGRPVVIDWTATWCINCRFVEATVLHSEVVQAEFRRSNALLLVADISVGHPTAQLMLTKLDSRSIPVLAVFSPKDPLRPVVLRDLYSRERVIKAVEAAAK